MKKLIATVFIVVLSIGMRAQYIGTRYLKDSDTFIYEIIDFDGNLVLQLPDNTFPFFHSYMMKKYEFESDGWTIDVGDRKIINDESFFITEENQNILALTNQDSTYLINFKGDLIKSFGKKDRYLSQPHEGIFIGFKPLKEDEQSVISVYIDSNGRELFDGYEFKQATHFNDGYAIIQEKDDKGDWKIIDNDKNEILNLSKKLNLDIVSAYPFINRYANITVRKTVQTDEINNLYFSYRINENGDLHELSENASILSDMYHRSYFKGEDYNSIVKRSGNIPYTIIDSIIGSKEKFYLLKDGNSQNRLVDNSGIIQDISPRYKIIKCIRNSVLGKSNSDYILFFPENKTSIIFDDETPLKLWDVLSRSDKLIEEFIIENNRILKFDHGGISSLLTLEGKVLFDFNEPQNESPKPLSMSQFIAEYDCPDQKDFENLIKNKPRLIMIKCSQIDLQDIANVKGASKIALIDVEELKNVHLLQSLLDQNFQISISGNLQTSDLKLDLIDSIPGILHLNEQFIELKK